MERRVVFPGWLCPALLLLPQLAVTFVFFFWPAGQAVVQSLVRQDAFGLTVRFAGLENFSALFADPTSIEPIGKVTSGGFGPSLNAPVAMGYLPTSLSALDTAVFAEVRGRRLPLKVAATPFVPNTYKR